MSERSHVGMSNCFVCLAASSVLLDKRLRPTLSRNMGPMSIDDLCSDCARRAAAGYIALVEITEKAREDDARRMKELREYNEHRPEKYRCVVVPCPERSARIPWMRRSALGRLIKGLDEHVVGCVLFVQFGVVDQIMRACGVSEAQATAAAEASRVADGADVDVVSGEVVGDLKAEPAGDAAPQG